MIQLNKRATIWLSIAIVAASVNVISCNNEEEVTQGRIIITNSSFDNRIDYSVDSTVILEDSEGGRSKKSFELKLRAEVMPPVYNGVVLRASHIYVDKDYAYVVYNLEGDPYLGGIEIFNIKDIKKPFIESQAIFINTDVSSVYYDNGKLYMAEATGDAGFSSPAVLEELEIQGAKLTTQSRRVELSSYAATDVTVSKDNIFATTGSTGGLYILDRKTLKETAFISLDDARAVTLGNSNTVITLQGTPARVNIYDEKGTLENKVTLKGGSIPQSKSMLVQKGSSIFVSAGDGGTYCIDRNTGKTDFNIPVPNVAGLDPSLAVCNSVSVAGDILYMANGEAGLYAAKIHGESEKYSELVSIKFSGNSSVNHVAAENKTIFLATGKGGLKIVEME